jgi:hypothetical protein
VSPRFNAAALALAGIQEFSDNEREALIELLRVGRLGLGSEAALSPLVDRAFTWPEFDRWQAFFSARGVFPSRWDGLHAAPSSRAPQGALVAYQRGKLHLLVEWLDTLTQSCTQLQHYTRQGRRVRIARQGDGHDCPVCEEFEAVEITQEHGTLPPFHPGCRCVLMARDGPLARSRRRR